MMSGRPLGLVDHRWGADAEPGVSSTGTSRTSGSARSPGNQPCRVGR